MTSDEMRNFIDCVTYEDCTVKWKGSIFWCLGLTYNSEKGEYCIEVYEERPGTREFVRGLMRYTSKSQDECMRHFLEDGYWDGKSFYEVAAEMEWVDL